MAQRTNAAPRKIVCSVVETFCMVIVQHTEFRSMIAVVGIRPCADNFSTVNICMKYFSPSAEHGFMKKYCPRFMFAEDLGFMVSVLGLNKL